MSKTAFLFPGQGAQKCGMGKDFYESDADAKRIFDHASELLSLDMPKLIFEPDDRLDLTEYTQAAMVTTGLAMLESVRKTGLKADVCAGLSLGEYEALVLCGAMSADDAVLTVRERGKLMQEAVPAGVGTMAAVLGTDASLIEKIVSETENVWIANYNCPGQIVISGTADGVREAGERLKSAGAKRIIPLNVSGPFHSGMLKEAGERLGKVLSGVSFHTPEIPYVANFTGKYVTDEKEIRDLLIRQVSGSVRFEQSIRAMIENGTDTFIEIGPGHTLTGFVRKISADVKAVSIETLEQLKTYAEGNK